MQGHALVLVSQRKQAGECPCPLQEYLYRLFSIKTAPGHSGAIVGAGTPVNIVAAGARDPPTPVMRALSCNQQPALHTPVLVTNPTYSSLGGKGVTRI